MSLESWLMEASAYVCLISESPSFISLISFPLKLPPDSHVHSQVASHCCSCRVKTRLPRVCSTISLGIENWSQNFCTSQSLKDRRTVASQWVGNGGRVLLKMWVHTHTQAEDAVSAHHLGLCSNALTLSGRTAQNPKQVLIPGPWLYLVISHITPHHLTDFMFCLFICLLSVCPFLEWKLSWVEESLT